MDQWVEEGPLLDAFICGCVVSLYGDRRGIAGVAYLAEAVFSEGGGLLWRKPLRQLVERGE